MPSDQENTRDQETVALCQHCGKAFSAFLHQMEEQNAKVVCPDCDKENECTPPPDTVKELPRKA